MLRTLKLLLHFQQELLVFLEFYTSRLNFDFEIDILLKRALNVIWSQLGESFFQEMYFELQGEVFLLKRVYNLCRY
jgi:hypothetical protein